MAEWSKARAWKVCWRETVLRGRILICPPWKSIKLLFLKKDLYKNQILQISDVEILRPCPIDAIMPYEINNIKGKKIKKDMKKGEYLKWIDLT